MSPPGKIHLYEYVPSLAPAVIAIAVFATLTALHTYRFLKTRMWFCIPFTVGGVFELIGYIGRMMGHFNSTSNGPYITQAILILLAPALFAATIYMTLGRLMRVTHGEHYSIIRVKWLTKCFVAGDVLSFFVQGGGGGIMTGGDASKVRLGENVILCGLFLQIIMFSLFVVASFIFHKRMRNAPTQKSADPDLAWEKMLHVLYSVSAMILIRNIFRVVEYISGRTGPLLRVEWPSYVFDALLMTATMTIFFVGYPTIIRQKVIVRDPNLDMDQV